MIVTVYSNPGCGPCAVTKRHLTKRGVPWTPAEASDHPEVVALALDRGEKAVAPIVTVTNEDGVVLDVWTQYRRDKIDALPLP